MAVKNTQIYGVQINGKWICKSKKLKVDISATPKKNSDTGPIITPKAEANYSFHQLKGRTKKTYFEMYCFKSTFLNH